MWPSSSTSPVRNTAQLVCITFCILEPQLRGRRAAGGVAELVEARQRVVGGILRQLGLLVAGREQFGATQRGGAAEHHEIDQRIRAEPVGAVHRHAGGLAQRHQAGNNGVGIAVLLGQRLAVIIRGNAAHVVVRGRQHRDRLARDIDAGENAGEFRDARQPLVQHRWDRDGRGAGR